MAFWAIVHVRVFSLNRFEVERVGQFAFSCLPYGGQSRKHRCFAQMPVTTEAILRSLIGTFIPPTNEIVFNLTEADATGSGPRLRIDVYDFGQAGRPSYRLNSAKFSHVSNGATHCFK
jgi:hypothetical protein